MMMRLYTLLINELIVEFDYLADVGEDVLIDSIRKEEYDAT
jgi:hypothetical protein